MVEEGHFDNLTHEHKKLLHQVKQYLHKKHNVVSNDFWNDWTILRFCRARKFHLEKITHMIDKFFTWAHEINFDNIGQLDMSRYRTLRQLYSHGYYNTDKQGRPVYIEEVKKLKAKELFETYTDIELVSYYVQSYQRLLHVIFPECSRVKGHRIENTCTIMDLKDVPLFSLFGGKVKTFTKIATDIA